MQCDDLSHFIRLELAELGDLCGLLLGDASGDIDWLTYDGIGDLSGNTLDVRTSLRTTAASQHQRVGISESSRHQRADNSKLMCPFANMPRKQHCGPRPDSSVSPSLLSVYHTRILS